MSTPTSPKLLLPRFLCALLLGAAALTVSATPLRVRGLAAPPDTEWRFPFVEGGGDAHVAARINQYLFIDNFESMAPARAADGLRGVDAEQRKRLSAIDFKVARNDARVLALRLEGESCGAYCEGFGVTEAFDAVNGRHLDAAALFTPEGLKAAAQKVWRHNGNAIRAQIASLQKVGAAGTSDDADDAIAMYKDCLSEREDPGYQKLVGAGTMEIEAQAVVFSQGRCSNHAMQALDDLGQISLRFPLAQLKPWLTAYGRALLLGEGEAAPAGSGSPFGQVMFGSIDGRLPVTLMLRPPQDNGLVSGVYFYDRFRKPIDLSGQLRNGTLELEESEGGNKWRLSLQQNGSQPGLHGEWHDGRGGRTLPVVMAP